MTKRIHIHANYTTVGMLQVLNEPVHMSAWAADAADMTETFYPAAYERIQAMEGYLDVADEDKLHIQFMVGPLPYDPYDPYPPSL